MLLNLEHRLATSPGNCDGRCGFRTKWLDGYAKNEVDGLKKADEITVS